MSNGGVKISGVPSHACDMPTMPDLPTRTTARWRCPECGSRWRYTELTKEAIEWIALFPYTRNFWREWTRVSKSSRRWRRREHRRISALLTQRMKGS